MLQNYLQWLQTLIQMYSHSYTIFFHPPRVLVLELNPDWEVIKREKDSYWFSYPCGGDWNYESHWSSVSMLELLVFFWKGKSPENQHIYTYQLSLSRSSDIHIASYLCYQEGHIMQLFNLWLPKQILLILNTSNLLSVIGKKIWTNSYTKYIKENSCSSCWMNKFSIYDTSLRK